MTPPVVLLGLPDSPLGPRLADLLTAQGWTTQLLDLDATLNGEPVTVRGDTVVWQGCPLHEAAAIWLEQPLFPWPQMLPAPCPLPDVENFERWRTYQREARALAASALAVAGDHVPVINPLVSAHLAVTPTAVFDLLAAADLPVHPWRIGAPPGPSDLVLDATGHERWHPAAPLPDDAPRLVIDSVDGPVTDMLIVDDAVVGARAWADGLTWAAASQAPVGADAGGDLMDLGRRVITVLGLEVTQVTCAGTMEGPVVLRANAAPRLAAWDDLLNGAVATALARRLADLAAATRGDTP